MATVLLNRYKELDLGTFTPGTRFVLWVYCDAADRYTLSTFISTHQVVKLTGMAERSVQRSREELAAGGMLALVSRGCGRRKSSVYRVTIGLEPTPVGSIPPMERQRLVNLGVLPSE